VFLIGCIAKIVRGRESNIQEFTTDRLFDDDNDDEDNPLIQ
ncbi:unnamed protein product, partial [Rotaria magnacalcarata]